MLCINPRGFILDVAADYAVHIPWYIRYIFLFTTSLSIKKHIYINIYIYIYVGGWVGVGV